jgi:hypothetical protein
LLRSLLGFYFAALVVDFCFAVLVICLLGAGVGVWFFDQKRGDA